ncbi:DUF3012 domain-containing protein [Shewanella gelidii]|uniref:DUF3012 domain-containing protein n=1 Tax=Shewanella gelidii TaxID=1642821 RepID=A0A917K1G8_9GAMM|nr:DUF3012 domain-containing protein [Shewanella gelidii]MCL1099604.1 DUF3012 domain-containing protein [Shewanella gelidii]GGI92689.1 hypothetical protein GCM10009332_32460 [Shewanella gelidii]
MSMKKSVSVALALAFAASLTACAPEVGSEAWCKKLEDKPKGDWTANEATDYAKHCVFK